MRHDLTPGYKRPWFRHTKKFPRRYSEHHLLLPGQLCPRTTGFDSGPGRYVEMHATNPIRLFCYTDRELVVRSHHHRCPEILRAASQSGPFTREQIVRQLKQYGDPTIILAPTNYTIAGHPAAITVASVAIPADPGKVAPIIYAAKACALGSVSLRTRKRSDPVEPLTDVLCFDFTTQNSVMLNQMFSFIIQFENSRLEPMFPGSVIRNIGGISRR
jgi:hypothetical protein